MWQWCESHAIAEQSAALLAAMACSASTELALLYPAHFNAALKRASTQVGVRLETSRASSSNQQVQRHSRSRPPHMPQPAHNACALPPAVAPHAACGAAAAAARCATAARPAAACTGGSTGRSAGGCRRSGRLQMLGAAQWHRPECCCACTPPASLSTACHAYKTACLLDLCGQRFVTEQVVPTVVMPWQDHMYPQW